MSLPVIDLSERMASTAVAIERACRDSGFFYVTGHGVPAALIAHLNAAAREFLRPSDAAKMSGTGFAVLRSLFAALALLLGVGHAVLTDGGLEG